MVAGNIIIDEAKIGGITPEMLIFRGKCELCPPYTLLADYSFCILNGNPALRGLTKNNECHNKKHEQNEKGNKKQSNLSGLYQLNRVDNCRWASVQQFRRR